MAPQKGGKLTCLQLRPRVYATSSSVSAFMHSPDDCACCPNRSKAGQPLPAPSSRALPRVARAWRAPSPCRPAAAAAPTTSRAHHSAHASPTAPRTRASAQGLPNTSSSASLRMRSAESISASLTLSGGRKRTVSRAPAPKTRRLTTLNRNLIRNLNPPFVGNTKPKNLNCLERLHQKHKVPPQTPTIVWDTSLSSTYHNHAP